MEYSKNEAEIIRLRAEVDALKKQNGELVAEILRLRKQAADVDELEISEDGGKTWRKSF